MAIGADRDGISEGPVSTAGVITGPLSDALRDAIAGSGLTLYGLGQATGVHIETISYFLASKSGLEVSTADRIFEVLGLKVIWGATANAGRHPQSITEAVRSAIAASGLSAWAVAKRSGLSHPTIQRFLARHRVFKLDTAAKIADAVGFDLEREILTLPLSEARPEPGPWDDWDAAVCPGHVSEDGHFLVFGRDKGPIRSKSARDLFRTLGAIYPGGFTKAQLEKRRIAGDFRGIMTRWREKDGDCLAAIQLPGVKNGGLYRCGRPD